ncbi:hypothetical protein GCM10010466_34830 [Planomonospora alba]|uniref:Uncharacterized protein n=1 Tax=Planomonospora alba TaxID=161354 RepID=A0ABP6NBY0_9ACTN
MPTTPARPASGPDTPAEPAARPAPPVSADLLADALEWLRGLDGVRPEAADERLAELRARHPGVRMRLLRQREAATGDHHYDLLFPAPEGTVSLAFAPDRAIPWPLRGSQRTGEQLVLRVDGVDVTMERAVSVLDVLWEDTGLARRLVNAALVEQALATRGVALPADRLQEAVDAFRRARGLLTAQATRRWMAERGLTHARLEEIVAAEAAVAELRREVAGGRAEDFFTAHRAEFDRLRVVRLRYADGDRADDAAALLRAGWRAGGTGGVRPGAGGAPGSGGGTDPVTLAAEETLAGAATCRMEANGRGELVALFGVPAAEAGAGEVLGPARLPDGGFCVVCVLAVEPATLDHVTRGLVERRIFDDWLAEQRRHAHVEWFWGSRARTDELTAALPGGGADRRPRTPQGVVTVGTAKKTIIAIATQMRKPSSSQAQSWWRAARRACRGPCLRRLPRARPGRAAPARSRARGPAVASPVALPAAGPGEAAGTEETAAPAEGAVPGKAGTRSSGAADARPASGTGAGALSGAEATSLSV